MCRRNLVELCRSLWNSNKAEVSGNHAIGMLQGILVPHSFATSAQFYILPQNCSSMRTFQL